MSKCNLTTEKRMDGALYRVGECGNEKVIDELREQLKEAEKIIMEVSNSTRPGGWDITRAYQDKYMKNSRG